MLINNVQQKKNGQTQSNLKPWCKKEVIIGKEIWYVMLYLLTAIVYPPGDCSAVHIYTQTIHRTTQNKQYMEQHKNKYIEQYKTNNT